MASSAHVEERFRCAVEVIQSLPKKGSFQPSNEMLLRFYSLFKQASHGPCIAPRPAFWDPIGRAKYDAWHSLGDMSRHEAMESYVEELKKIVEVMPQTDEVESFTRSLGRFYEMVDLEKPPTLIRATTGKPSPLRTPSPGHKGNASGDRGVAIDDRQPQIQQYVEHLSDSDAGDDTADEDQYVDTFDQHPVVIPQEQIQNNQLGIVISSLERLQVDVSSLSSRLSNIEHSLVILTTASQNRHASNRALTDSSIIPFRLLKFSGRVWQIIIFILPLITSVWFARRFFKRR